MMPHDFELNPKQRENYQAPRAKPLNYPNSNIISKDSYPLEKELAQIFNPIEGDIKLGGIANWRNGNAKTSSTGRRK